MQISAKEIENLHWQGDAMNLKQLIEAAQKAAGSYEPLADGLGMSKLRLSDWKAGRRRPEASEIAYLAEIAGYL